MGDAGTPKLGIIIASVREARVGHLLGEWVAEQAREYGGFEVDVIDLAQVALPMTTSEPNHPRVGPYVNESTKAWSGRIAACQAFVIVTPEYNFGMPASLKNALDLVSSEWNYKPVAFASYGGISGGLRSVEQIKQVVLPLRMVPVPEAIVAPMVFDQFVDGAFEPNQVQQGAAKQMFDELSRMTEALRPLQG
ncbi:NADPH-dependent FMN reductase [Tomitella fengzijianii]|uniref:NAD(P)H-dependent oxidoreductase n=1 Tax=Tomitella fengzijianii TaxID=2597660 RepID=A0A516X3B4_9ACTN|nr:NAD(P)H-dependent oxidoreductase [Tomitella fengzijianii]QDQ97548.1 NAD(P)H-dependent oxidoreductase [Tomitella fengzijianii]